MQNTFKEINNGAVQNALSYGEEFNVKIDKEFVMLKLQEEVGELAQAVLIHEKKSRPEKFLPEVESKQALAEELADVVGMAMVVAHTYGVDLEEAIVNKWVNRD